MNLYIVIVTLSVSFSGSVILFYDTLTNFILYTKTFHTFFSVDYSLILYETTLGPVRYKNGWDPYTSILFYIYGGIGGMVLCWLLGNHISRKNHLIIGSLIIALSCFLLFFNITTSKYFHYSVHCIGGMGTAFLRVITPIYLAELATKSKRGMILSTFHTMKYFGRVLAITIIIYLIHHDHQKYAMSEEDMRHQWDKDHDPKTFQSETFSFPYTPSNYSNNILKFLKVFPCIIFLLLIFFFIPNSPRYLFYSKHYNKAFKILYRLYTPKKLVTISEEDLPWSFFQQIYNYRKKTSHFYKHKSNHFKIVPVTDMEEEELEKRFEIYNTSIYTSQDTDTINNNKLNDTSTKTLVSPKKNYYHVVDEEDQIDNFIDNMEKNKEAIKKAEIEKREKEKKKKEKEVKKMNELIKKEEIENERIKREKELENKKKKEMEMEMERKKKIEIEKENKRRMEKEMERKKQVEIEKENKRKMEKENEKEKEKLRRMRRHRKGRSADPYFHDKIVRYKNDDSLDIIFNSEYNQNSSFIFTSKVKLPPNEINNTDSNNYKMRTNNSVSIIHTVIKEDSEEQGNNSKENEANYDEILKKINNNKRVYSKTKKYLIPKDDNSSVIINIGGLDDEYYSHHNRHRRYHTEPATSINVGSNKSNPNDKNSSNTEDDSSDANDFTIIINRNIYKINPGTKNEKYETEKNYQLVSKKVTKNNPLKNIGIDNDTVIEIKENKEASRKKTDNQDEVIIKIKNDDNKKYKYNNDIINKRNDKKLPKYNNNDFYSTKRDDKNEKENKKKSIVNNSCNNKYDGNIKEYDKKKHIANNDCTDKYNNTKKDDKKKPIVNNNCNDKYDNNTEKDDKKRIKENNTNKKIKNKNEEEKKKEEKPVSTTESSAETLIMKASSSESLAYHQFKDFDFEPVVSHCVMNINEEIEKNREMSFFQFYWGHLKNRFALTVIMNMTQQLIQFVIFISYFNLLSEQILYNYLHIFYFFITEFLLFIPVNIYLTSRNRRIVLLGGLAFLSLTYFVLVFALVKYKNFYFYFTSVLVIIYNGSWSIIPVIYQTEIFPTRARVAGSSLGCLVSQCCHLILFLCLPYAYKYNVLIFCLVVLAIIIFIIFSIFFMKDTNNVELEKVDEVFKRTLTPKKIKKKIKQMSSMKNINPIKKVSFAIVNHNREESKKSKSDNKKKIIPI